MSNLKAIFHCEEMRSEEYVKWNSRREASEEVWKEGRCSVTLQVLFILAAIFLLLLMLFTVDC